MLVWAMSTRYETAAVSGEGWAHFRSRILVAGHMSADSLHANHITLCLLEEDGCRPVCKPPPWLASRLPVGRKI